MIAALPGLESQKGLLHVTHQTGEADQGNVRSGYEAAGWQGKVDVRPYIDDMVSEFAKADLVICRAGATTSAELVAAGKAAILVPFPLAADDHQRKNAEALQAGGAAQMILQKELTGERLANEIKSFLAAPEKISEMEIASRKLARRDAATASVDLMEVLVKQKAEGRRQ